MSSESILIVLHPDSSLAGRKNVQRKLVQLGADFQLEFNDGFIVRMEGNYAPLVRAWKEVRVAGGVHLKEKMGRVP